MNRQVHTKSFFFSKNSVQDSDVVVFCETDLFKVDVWVLWSLLDWINNDKPIIGKMSFYHWGDTRPDRPVAYDKDGALNVSITWKTLVLHSII